MDVNLEEKLYRDDTELINRLALLDKMNEVEAKRKNTGAIGDLGSRKTIADVKKRKSKKGCSC